MTIVSNPANSLPVWVIHVTAAISAYPIWPKSGHSANPGFMSTRPSRANAAERLRNRCPAREIQSWSCRTIPLQVPTRLDRRDIFHGDANAADPIGLLLVDGLHFIE